MLMRWGIRAVASIFGLAALVGVGWVVRQVATPDESRVRFREGIEASALIRQDTGRDCNLRVDPVGPGDDRVIVTVEFDDVPFDSPFRKELTRNTNILVRRAVHHVKEVKVFYDDTPDVLPSWDGGVAVAAAPVPIGMDAPLPPAMKAIPPEPAPYARGAPDAGVAAAAPPASRKSAGKTGSGVVTLVTFPDADVFRGGKKLGRTPLFNAELPVGTHLLTLVGDDGKKRRISLPVKSGKNAPLKFDLADLPAK